jgi:phosphoribosyl-ATP pyrophosphohydrolase
MPRITHEERDRLMTFSYRAIDKLNTPKNQAKGHWSASGIDYLFSRLLEESQELKGAIKTGRPDAIINECKDVINFALMIWDNTEDAGQGELF